MRLPWKRKRWQPRPLTSWEREHLDRLQKVEWDAGMLAELTESHDLEVLANLVQELAHVTWKITPNSFDDRR